LVGDRRLKKDIQDAKHAKKRIMGHPKMPRVALDETVDLTAAGPECEKGRDMAVKEILWIYQAWTRSTTVPCCCSNKLCMVLALHTRVGASRALICTCGIGRTSVFGACFALFS
jgi:hypothetical protein